MKHRVSEQLLQREITTIREFGMEYDWELTADFEELTIITRMYAKDHEEYVFAFDCSNYDQAPPYVEVVHPETEKRDVPDAFFDDRGRGGGTALLWHRGPALCHAFNRKMYMDIDQVHHDWNPATISDWKQLADPHNTLGDIHELIYRRLHNKQYQGRFGGN